MCYSALVKQSLDHLGRELGAIVIREQLTDQRLEPRIYPGHYAPVGFWRGESLVVHSMRYGAYPPFGMGDRKGYTTFNARRDNLQSPFWADAFLKHHGIVALEGFYEWVAVADLLKAGVVTLADVRTEFVRQAEERQKKVLAAGKKYKPTPTEMKNPVDRQIIIEFRPEDGTELFVPAIFSEARLADGKVDQGFAIVTDEPTPEISAAGHDRCPVILEPSAVQAWLRFGKRTAKEVDQILAQRQRVTFRHRIAEVA